MKLFNVICIIIFILFAVLQYNDPDPYIWMPVYLYGALLCYLSIRNKYYPLMYIAGLSLYASYSAVLFFDKTGVLNWAGEHHAESIVHSMKAGSPWIEETREFGGLIIVIAVLIINMSWLQRKRRVSNFSIH
jgi:Transmembrane family 220, helix